MRKVLVARRAVVKELVLARRSSSATHRRSRALYTSPSFVWVMGLVRLRGLQAVALAISGEVFGEARNPVARSTAASRFRVRSSTSQ